MADIISDAECSPSLLGTQPWTFRFDGDSVLLFTDRQRQLADFDPEGQGLVISCGTTLATLRVSAYHRGLDAHIEPFPDPIRPELLARIDLVPRAASAPKPTDDDLLYLAIRDRKPHWGPLATEPPRPGIASVLVQTVAANGAELCLLSDPAARNAVAEITREAIEAQGRSPGVVSDIRGRLQESDRTGEGALRPGGSLSSPALARRKAALLREAPLVGVVRTTSDHRREWLAAGMAIGAMLLRAHTRGLVASYTNEAVEVGGAFRRRLSGVVGGGCPQAVFRIGRPLPADDA